MPQQDKTQDSLYLKHLDSIRERGTGAVAALREAIPAITHQHGIQGALNLILRLEVGLKLRKPSIGLYDHTFHLIGGGEKYGLTVADILKKDFDVTLIGSKPFSHDDISRWYSMDLSECPIRIVELPFFEDEGGTHVDPGKVTIHHPNPFHRVSRVSGEYDIFINNSMNEMVYPLSNISVMICHFPERRPASYFYSDQYTQVVYNSRYTARWIEKRWKFKPHTHIYPPVDMEVYKDGKKEKIILSVARFEQGGSKKQKEMVRTFIKLKQLYPEKFIGWQLVLAGGSHSGNTYLEELEEMIAGSGVSGIQLKVNISDQELKELYQKSSIFWHLCGLDQTDPALVEHFGMTIVESMQNSLVPIVFNGGGQKEIVVQDESGFRVNTTMELMKHTVKLVSNPELLKQMSRRSYVRSQHFSMDQFHNRIIRFFKTLSESLVNPETKHEQ